MLLTQKVSPHLSLTRFNSTFFLTTHNSPEYTVSEWEAVAHAAQAEVAGHKATVEQLERLVEKQENDLARMRVEAEEERTEHKEAEQEASATIEQLKETVSKQKAESLEHQNSREQMILLKDKAEEAGRAERVERDVAVKEAAELKGQVESLKTQNAELLALFGSREEKKEDEGKAEE